MLDAQSGKLHAQDPATRQNESCRGGPLFNLPGMSPCYADSGGASRFFFRADYDEGEGET